MTPGLSTGLKLAAAPSFALMAALTAHGVDAPASMICSAATESILGGMAPMYLIMTLFHASAWLDLFSHRRVRGDRDFNRERADDTGFVTAP